MALGKESTLKSVRRWKEGESALKNIDFFRGVVMFLLLCSASILDGRHRYGSKIKSCT